MFTVEQMNAIDACMKEAGQPPVEWRKDGVWHWGDGTPQKMWMDHPPLEVMRSGKEALDQWNAYYRQALIVVGIVSKGYYDDKADCPVGRLPVPASAANG